MIVTDGRRLSVPGPQPGHVSNSSKATPLLSFGAESLQANHFVGIPRGEVVGIELDPCSNSREHPNVPALAHLVQAENGLSQVWYGKVYM